MKKLLNHLCYSKNIFSNLNKFASKPSAEAIKKIDDATKPPMKGNKYYEPYLPGDNDDLKYIALKESRTVGNKKFYLDHVNTEHQLIWKNHNSINDRNGLSMRAWMKMYSNNAESDFTRRNGIRPREPIETRLNPTSLKQEYKETDVFAVELGLGGWRHTGEIVHIADYNLHLTVRGPSKDQERLMYYTTGTTDYARSFRFYVGKKQDGTDADQQYFAERQQWLTSQKVVYKL